MILWAIIVILSIPAVIGAVGAAVTGDITGATMGLPTWLLVWAIIATLIANIVTIPIFTIGETLLYFDLRVRKQGYDLNTLSSELGLASPPTDAVA